VAAPAGGDQVAHPRQAGERLRSRAARLAEAGHLGEAARDQGRLGVVAEAEPIHPAGRKRHHVLGRCAELDSGGVDGLGLGDNAKAALIARGLAEMARLGEACGARAETFSGLAGMGDLIATCWSRHGRNRRAGELIALGTSPDEAAAEIGTVEGLTTAPVLRDLSHRLGIELPITEGVCLVLDGSDLNELAAGLMGRQPTRE
jgi:hypothetical protein